jgi:hypothetical protein
MIALTRRLSRLEDRFVPRDDPERRRLAELLRARRRRRIEESGQVYVEPDPMPEDFRSFTIAEVLRARRRSRQPAGP